MCQQANISKGNKQSNPARRLWNEPEENGGENSCKRTHTRRHRVRIRGPVSSAPFSEVLPQLQIPPERLVQWGCLAAGSGAPLPCRSASFGAGPAASFPIGAPDSEGALAAGVGSPPGV